MSTKKRSYVIFFYYMIKLYILYGGSVLNKTKYCSILVLFLIAISSFSLSGENYRDNALSFIPVKTKNIVAVNLKYFFKYYDYKDIYKFTLFDKKNKKGILKILSGIMKKAGIDPEKDLNYLLFSNSRSINIMDIGKFTSGIVSIFKLNYKPHILEKAIMSSLEKLKIKVTRGRINKKRFISLGKKIYEYIILMYDKRTIIIGKKDKVVEYMNTFQKEKKKFFSNKKMSSVIEAMKKNSIFAYYFDFSGFLKEIIEQNDGSFNMDLTKVKHIEGSLDSDNFTWRGKVYIVSDNKKGNVLTVNGLRKLLGMSAMGGTKYIKIVEKINIKAVKKGIQIFFTFDVE